VPTSILATCDDPVCPATDLAKMSLPSCVEVTLTRYGGHCGFIRDRHLDSWAEDYIVRKIAEARISSSVEAAVVENKAMDVRGNAAEC
jgi:predicted alpha/beta-fold hydrolase